MRGAERPTGARSRVYLSQTEDDTKWKTKSTAIQVLDTRLRHHVAQHLCPSMIEFSLKQTQSLRLEPRGLLVCSGINLRECRL